MLALIPVPCVQSMGQEVEPFISEIFPGAHSLHVLGDMAPTAAEKEPEEQLWHEVEAKALAYRPPSHSTHVELEIAPMALEKRPNGHP